MLSSGVHGRGLLDRLREGADFDTVTPEKEIEDQKNDLLGEKWLVWYKYGTVQYCRDKCCFLTKVVLFFNIRILMHINAF